MKQIKNYPGITSRNEHSIQMMIPYKGQKIYETIPIKNTALNRKAVYAKRCVIIRELKDPELKFDYSEHFPDGKNAERFARMSGDNINIRERLKNYKKKIEKLGKLEDSTLQSYLRTIEHITELYGDDLLSSITRLDIQEWADSCDVVQKTINNRLIIWKAIYKQAMLDDQIKKDILYDWTPEVDKESDYEKNPFSEKESQQILKAIKENSPEAYSFYLFRFALGMRPCEIFGLTWSRYNELEKNITIMETIVDGVKKAKPKTKAGIRMLKLNKPALKAINIQKKLTYKDGGLIFTNPAARNKDKEWNYNTISSRWIKALKAANIEYRRPYNTRHTFATINMANDTTIYNLSVALGHKDMATTTRAYVGSTASLTESDTSTLDNVFNLADNK